VLFLWRIICYVYLSCWQLEYRSTVEGFHPLGVDKWVVGYNEMFAKHSVNAYEVKAGMVFFAGQKLCDPCLSAIEWFVPPSRYTSALIYLLYLYISPGCTRSQGDVDRVLAPIWWCNIFIKTKKNISLQLLKVVCLDSIFCVFFVEIQTKIKSHVIVALYSLY